MTRPVMDRLMEKIQVRPDTGCWEFQGSRLTCGYGRILWNGRLWLTHRVTYTVTVGPIPEGLEIDHLCKNKPCCNPGHLEAVTRSENLRRGPQGELTAQLERAKTHCPLGHPYDETNTYVTPRGHRQCRQCKRIALNKYEAKASTREMRRQYARQYRANLKASQ